MSQIEKTAVVTGASAGIGAATAVALAESGFSLVLGARRIERLLEVAEPLGADARYLDVTDPESVEQFVAPIDRVDVLVNNAGGALGVDRVEEAPEDRWREMWEVNFLGVARMTRRLLQSLRSSGDGHIVNVGSIAGFETYPGGAGYTGSKHAVRALTRTLRLELLGEPIRVTEICPGLVEAGMQPLTAEDIADCIAWAATRPPHVNIDEIVVRPRDQAAATMVHRR
jgi:NADP-dependent 3-hydroxy acid dehydrogenase YdfG